MVEIVGELVQHPLCLAGVLRRQLLRQSQLDRHRDQVLLSAVMEIAFDALPLGIGGRDDAGS